MSIVNSYSGATVSQLGATYLDSRALIEIKEGFDIGSSTQYVNVGRFTLNSVFNGGPNNEQLGLEAVSPAASLATTNLFNSRRYKSGTFYFDNFSDTNRFTANFRDDLIADWGLSGNALVALANDTMSRIQYTGEAEMTDVQVVAKFRSNALGSSGIVSLWARWDEDNTLGYAFKYDGGNFYIQRWDSSGSTNISGSTTITLGNSTWHYMMFSLQKSSLSGYYSSTGGTFKQVFDITDDSYKSGEVAIGVKNAQEVNFDLVDIASYKPLYTSEDMLQRAVALGTTDGASVTGRFTGFIGAGVSRAGVNGDFWSLGTTNGFVQLDLTATGTKSDDCPWHYYNLTDASIRDFVAECDVYSTADNLVGMLIADRRTIVPGPLGEFNLLLHAGGIRVGSSGNPESYLEGVNNRLSTSGLTASTYSNSYLIHGGFDNLPSPNRWYHLKIARSGLQLMYSINDKVYAHGYIGETTLATDNEALVGASAFLDADLSYNAEAGVAVYTAGTSGSRVSFRNFRISELDTLQSDTIFGPGTAAESIVSQYLPDGYVLNYSTDHSEIFIPGSSRGSQGLTSGYISSNNSRAYPTPKMTIGSIKDLSRYSFNTEDIGSRQQDTGLYIFKNASESGTLTAAERLGEAALTLSNDSDKILAVRVIGHPHVERGDRIAVVNTVLGVSGTYIVDSHTRSYAADTAEYISDFSMHKDGD